MYLTASRPDIMFVVCACAMFQVTPKVSHLHVVKRIFRYLKCQLKLGLWYPRDSPFELESFSDSDYAGVSLDRKSTTGVEYVAAANCCGQVLWIQNQMLDYGFIFINTKIYIDNESTICIVKNPMFHSKTKHIEIRHHFIRDSYEKKLIQVIKIHTYYNVADLLTKAFDVSSDKFEVKTVSHKVNAARQDLVLLGEIDFLATNSIHHALIVSPTIYASYIEQFWATAKSKTINDVKQIHATVDGKTVITLVEPFNNVYTTPAHTKKVFTNMKRQNKDFSRRVTPLFASMLAPPVVKGEGSGQPSKPQQPSSTTQPIIEEQIPVTKSSSPQNTQSPRQALKEELSYSNYGKRATTTAASLDATQASGNITKTQSTAMSNDPFSQEIGSGVNTPGSDEERFEQQDLTDNVPPTPHNSPLSGGYTLGSDEGRPNINELMAICTKLSNRVLALENSKTAQDLVIQKLKKRVKRLKKALRVRTPGMKLFKIGTSRRKGLEKKDASKQERKSDKTKPMFNDSDFDELNDAVENVEGGSTAQQITTAGDTLNTTSVNVSTVRPSNVSAAGPSTSTAGDIFEDEMTTIVDTLVAIRSARPRTTSVVIRDVEEEPRRATPVPIVQIQDKGKGKMVEPEPTPKNPIKAPIARDAEIAQRLFEEEQAQFEKEQRIVREKATEQEAKDAALIDQMEDVQARIDADALLAARLQEQEREQFSIYEQARFLVETIAERKRFFVA
ncbi:hypothetical protein Tco_1147344 [Tanacetum coccineum]